MSRRNRKKAQAATAQSARSFTIEARAFLHDGTPTIVRDENTPNAFKAFGALATLLTERLHPFLRDDNTALGRGVPLSVRKDRLHRVKITVEFEDEEDFTTERPQRCTHCNHVFDPTGCAVCPSCSTDAPWEDNTR